MKTSLVIPAYNEEIRLQPFLQSIAQYLERHRQDLNEIIVVDDGSQDKTVTVIQRYKQRIPGLKLIQHAHNEGKGAAVQTGVLAAKGDYIVFMDADGATDISELPKMLVALNSAPIAVGNRWMPGAKTERHSSLRRFAGWLYRRYMGLFGLGKIDTMCGFKGYHRVVGRQLFQHLQEKRWLFDTEIAYRAIRAGYAVNNFPIRWESKDGSKLPTRTLIRSAWQIWPLIRRLKRALKTA